MGTAGHLDINFPHGILYGFDKNIHDIKIQTDNKIIISGDFEHYDYNGTTFFSPYLCRLDVDGSFDLTFDITAGSVGFNNSVKTVHIQNDGKIIVGGEFTQIIRNGITYSYSNIIRFNTDGSIDTSFNVGTGFNNTVEKIEVKSNNKLVVGGRFTEYNGSSANFIIQLNTDGSIDNSFNIGTGFIGTYVSEIINDGDTLLIGGDFTNYNGTPVNNLTRLLSNGDIDGSFNIGTGFNDTVLSIGVQSTGQIIVGGLFTEFNGINLYYGCIVRLNSDGSYSNSFSYGLDGVYGGVTSICVQSNNKIIVGGFFTKYHTSLTNFIDAKNLIKFLPTCEIDTDFYLNPNYNDVINAITLFQGNDYLFIGGDNNFPPFNHFGKLINEALTPISANTEYFMCISCSGETKTISVPHPTYTNGRGREIVQLNAIALGGENGLNN